MSLCNIYEMWLVFVLQRCINITISYGLLQMLFWCDDFGVMILVMMMMMVMVMMTMTVTLESD